MEKGGSHETRAVREVMLTTIALGGSGTPVRGRGREEEREGGGRGRQRGRREGEDYMSQLILPILINVLLERYSVGISLPLTSNDDCGQFTFIAVSSVLCHTAEL